MDTTDEQQMLAFFLPEGTLEYLELARGTKTTHAIHLVLEEKNHPPLAERQQGKRVYSKGFRTSPSPIFRPGAGPFLSRSAAGAGRWRTSRRS
ncbi:MAG: hypothetical protein KIT39_18455 [Nitrospirales bacterium]|nr:hypothetical protein [Nitrospirales bacterium]